MLVHLMLCSSGVLICPSVQQQSTILHITKIPMTNQQLIFQVIHTAVLTDPKLPQLPTTDDDKRDKQRVSSREIDPVRSDV